MQIDLSEWHLTMAPIGNSNAGKTGLRHKQMRSL